MADPQTATSKQNEHTRRSPSGADLVLLLLLILFGFGIWSVVELGFTEWMRQEEPSEQKIFARYGVTGQKARLTDVQNELTELQKYLNSARLEQLKQNAAVQSYVVTYPDLANTPPVTSVPQDTVRAYTEAKRLEQSARTVVSSLERRITTLKSEQNALSSQLETGEEAANSQLGRSNAWYIFRKRAGTLAVTLGVVLVLLWIVRVVLWAFAKKRMSTAEGFRPFVLAFGALALLFAYDQFSFAGAALIGVLLLLFILWRIKWPNKSVLVK